MIHEQLITYTNRIKMLIASAFIKTLIISRPLSVSRVEKKMDWLKGLLGLNPKRILSVYHMEGSLEKDGPASNKSIQEAWKSEF